MWLLEIDLINIVATNTLLEIKIIYFFISR